jgi:hypothetical protein
VCCGGVSCVDLQSDTQNCGTCGDACPAGDVCQAGSCVTAPCSSGLACAGGDTCCGGSCCDASEVCCQAVGGPANYYFCAEADAGCPPPCLECAD